MPSTSRMRTPSATPKTTTYRSEVSSGGMIVCIHTLVKRRTSRERSVLNDLSISIAPDHLQVHLFDVLRPEAVFQAHARVLRGDPATIYKRDLFAESLRLLEIVRREQDGESAVVELPDVLPEGVA